MPEHSPAAVNVRGEPEYPDRPRAGVRALRTRPFDDEGGAGVVLRRFQGSFGLCAGYGPGTAFLKPLSDSP